MKKQKLTFTKVDLSKRYNMIDPEGERMGDIEINNSILKKWEYTRNSIEGNGNVNYQCSFDLLSGRIVWDDEDWAKRIGLYNIISSPLLLYRLISVFGGVPECPGNAYKTIWWFSVRHIKTGKVLGFGEWKGASGFWLTEGDHTKLRSIFKKDLEGLLLFLVSDQIAHPYDGCTSGQIA